jgi:hypothetical protein
MATKKSTRYSRRFVHPKENNEQHVKNLVWAWQKTKRNNNEDKNLIGIYK